MPVRIRHSPLGPGLSLADLPILPFLAPRLLQPWPKNCFGRRPQSTASQQLESVATQYLDCQSQPASTIRQASSLGGLPVRTQAQGIGPQVTSDGGQWARRSHKLDSSHGGHMRSIFSPFADADSYALQDAYNAASDQCQLSTGHRLWELPHLDMLNNFILIHKNAKRVDRQNDVGTRWKKWFEDMWNTSQRARRRYQTKKPWAYAMQQIESMANFDPDTDVTTLQLKWLAIHPKAREQFWPGLMLGMLATRPREALKFLVATMSIYARPLPHTHHIQNSLDYIVWYHLYRQSPPITTDDFTTLFGVINDLLTQYSYKDMWISEYAIHHICKRADRPQIETLYKTLNSRQQKLSLRCQLFFVDSLARRGATDSAVRILESLHRNGADFTKSRVERVCTTLLRCSRQDPEAIVSEAQIFSLLIQWGVRPGIIFYTILAHNAAESGDHEAAWKIYDMLIENGIEPTHHTYSILLKDAKLRLDHKAMEYIIEAVKSNNITNRYIATDLLHAMWLMHRKSSETMPAEEAEASFKSLWQRMLLLYNSYFESGPLEDFAPEYFSADGKPSSRVEGGRTHPDFQTLVLMLTIAICSRFEQSELPQLYGRFKSLVEGGHPDFVKVATQTHVFDAFIRALGKHPQTLPFSTQILGDMLSNGTPVSTDQEGAQSTDEFPESHHGQGYSGKKIPSPSLFTWHRLVRSFMGQGQPRAAEKIVEMMESRGTRPDQAIWDALIVGYSQMQEMDSAMHAIQRAKLAGWTIEKSVLGRLGSIRNRILLARSAQRPLDIDQPGWTSGEEEVGRSRVPARAVTRPVLRRSDFQIDGTKTFIAYAESSTAQAELQVSRMIATAEQNMESFIATHGFKKLEGTREWLERFQKKVDARLR